MSQSKKPSIGYGSQTQTYTGTGVIGKRLDGSSIDQSTGTTERVKTSGLEKAKVEVRRDVHKSLIALQLKSDGQIVIGGSTKDTRDDSKGLDISKEFPESKQGIFVGRDAEKSILVGTAECNGINID